MDTDLIQSTAILITAAVSIYTAYKAGRKQAAEIKSLEVEVAEQVQKTYAALDQARQQEIDSIRQRAVSDKNRLEARIKILETENEQLRQEVEKLRRENTSVQARLRQVQAQLDNYVASASRDIATGPAGTSD